MTKKEYKELLEDYLNKNKQHKDYLSLFFTRYKNDILINKVQKSFSMEEIEKIKKLKKELDLSHEKWYKATISKEPLTD